MIAVACPMMTDRWRPRSTLSSPPRSATALFSLLCVNCAPGSMDNALMITVLLIFGTEQVGVAFGAMAAALPSGLKAGGLLQSAWPPDAVPGYARETLSDCPSGADSVSPRRAVAAGRSVGMATAVAAVRTAGELQTKRIHGARSAVGSAGAAGHHNQS